MEPVVASTPQWRSPCPIASGLDVVGDKWSLVIIRDLIVHGPRTYSEFLDAPEKISTNILAARLKWLHVNGLITHVDATRSARNNAYQLTERGAALRPVLEALGRWSHQELIDVHPGILSID